MVKVLHIRESKLKSWLQVTRVSRACNFISNNSEPFGSSASSWTHPHSISQTLDESSAGHLPERGFSAGGAKPDGPSRGIKPLGGKGP